MNTKKVLLIVLVILVVVAAVTFSLMFAFKAGPFEVKKEKAEENVVEDTTNTPKVSKVSDIYNDGYEKITDKQTISKDYIDFKSIVNYSFKKSVDSVTEDYAKSVAIYNFGYTKKVTKEYYQGYVKALFGYDVKIPTGKYNLKDSTYTAEVTKGTDEYYTIASNINYSTNETEWNEISEVYHKGDNYIIEFEIYLLTNAAENREDSTKKVIGKSYVFAKRSGEMFKVEKVVYEEVK